jgi:branched-subunit amino acid ABC-type transport system permease component
MSLVSGLFSAIGGVGLTMTTGIGSPRAGVLYTLSGLAAVVIGGVSLTAGRGGVVGPVIAAFVDLPEPEGPTTPISPGSIDSQTSRKTSAASGLVD